MYVSSDTDIHIERTERAVVCHFIGERDYQRIVDQARKRFEYVNDTCVTNDYTTVVFIYPQNAKHFMSLQTTPQELTDLDFIR